MPSVNDLHKHLERLTSAHLSHSAAITAAGEQVAAELEQARERAASVPEVPEYADTAPRPPAGEDTQA